MASTSLPVETPVPFAKKLSENTPVFAQRTSGGDPARHNGILIGNIRDEFLVISGFAVEFAVNERIILRMVVGNHLVGFETQVLRKFEDPRLYVVKFPLQIESLNLRKAQRIQAFFPAEVRLAKPAGGAADMYLLKTRVLDISAGGCSFRSKTRLAADTEVKISFSLPGDRHIQSVTATVIECTPAGSVFHNRVKFSQDAPNLPILQEIAKWVAESLSFTG